MLVYGDAERFEPASAVRTSIAGRLHECLGQAPGRERHAGLVSAFIRAGELAQGLADAEFDAKGFDDLSPVQEESSRFLLALAHAIVRSWDDYFAGDLGLPSDWEDLLDRLGAPVPLRIKQAEGYAYYALYPESYAEAAARSGLGADTVVIGIRGIGAGLAALVAAAIGAAPAVTVRPTGHPFERRIEVGPALAQRLLARDEVNFAIVDEGPGLSGSSFGGVADWLQERGVALERLHFFASHGGELGPQASIAHRTRWAKASRHNVDMDEVLIRRANPAQRLESWVRDLVGELDGPLEEISGGAWRERLYESEADWPSIDAQLERRKFLARAGGQTWLVKFAGLGAAGAARLAKGRVLAEAGHTPEIAGLRHGFLVQRWVEGAPLDVARPNRQQLIEAVGRYLGFRARHLPAGGKGASLTQLFTMARYNIGQALGDEMAAKATVALGDAERFTGMVHRVDTDNRLHRWEWRVGRDGGIVKTDALDHSAAHDLVGCQDISWDIAGAAVEFGLSFDERAHLAWLVGKENPERDRHGLLEVMQICYVGFQLGLWTYAMARSDDAERRRIKLTLDRYAGQLDALLGSATLRAEADYRLPRAKGGIG
jgi:hypothetical protein